jgi:hypothetical protein
VPIASMISRILPSSLCVVPSAVGLHLRLYLEPANWINRNAAIVPAEKLRNYLLPSTHPIGR